jgi:hypothetical protein
MKRFTLRNILILYILLPAAVYFLLWWGCQPMKLEPPPVELLAQEVSFSLGRDLVRLPLVAVSSSRTRENLQQIARLSKQSLKPIPVKLLSINVSDYDTFRYPGRDGAIRHIPELCPKLKRQWAREVCEERLNLSPEDFDNLSPKHFDLITVDNLERYVSRAGLTQKLLEARLPKPGGKIVTSCVLEPDSCTLISQNLVALWSGTGDTIRREKQAKFFKAFVKHALGEKEKFPELLAAHQRYSQP